jgi:hypothetical protein
MDDQNNVPRPRRSKHAERRARQGRRVSTAIRDLRQARIADVFLEVESGLFVVRGGKSREHIFRSDGVIVTSINSRTKAAHRRRVENGIIRPATPEEFEQLKALVK